jgi:hypothetical protein
MGHGSRTRLVTALVLVAVFGAGVLLGLAADSNLDAEPTEVVVLATDDGAAAEEKPRRSYIYEQVGPNESQLQLIDSIVAEHRARTNALDEEFRAEFRDILLGTREAIREVLTPEQAAEYQRLLDERYPPAAQDRENEDERD